MHAAFAVHRATVALTKVFLDGRCYDALNPYARKEFKEALVALADDVGVSNWMDTSSIFLNASLSGPVHSALCDLSRVFILGDNYEVKNPYSRAEVKAALSALASEVGVQDWMDTDTIFSRVMDPDMAAFKKKDAEQKKSLFNARVLEADIAFLTTRLTCRATALGEWSGASREDSMLMRLGLPSGEATDSLEGVGLFTVSFFPESTKVREVTAIHAGTGESLIDEKPKTLPAMGL
jgi:hypothetical protein